MRKAGLIDRRQLATCRQTQDLVTSFSGAVLDNDADINVTISGVTEIALWSCDHKNEQLIASSKVIISN